MDSKGSVHHGWEGLGEQESKSRAQTRLRQEDHGLETSLGYTVNSRPAWAAQQDLVSESTAGPKTWLGVKVLAIKSEVLGPSPGAPGVVVSIPDPQEVHKPTNNSVFLFWYMYTQQTPETHRNTWQV